MQCEILEYKYQTDWDLDNFLSDTKFNELCNSNWPLVTTTMTYVIPNTDVISMKQFIEGKRRGKPSELYYANTGATTTYIGNKLGLQGPAFNVNSACAGSLYSFYIAGLMSLDLQMPVVVFAGDNFNTDYKMWMFNSYGALDQNTGFPFDKSSKGFKMGVGTSLFIVKHPSVKSTLSVKAVIKSFNFYTRPDLAVNPGSADDIINHFSHINYKSIDLWNGHVTGTPIGDIIEYNFFAKTCKHDIPIIGYKGYIGHCMSAAGALEIGMMLDDRNMNILRPNLIPTEKIIADDRIITESTSFTYRKILKTSLAFGGRTVVSEIDLY
jgi:3-oxoacyl-(acyl-carrier-protein) synthase